MLIWCPLIGRLTDYYFLAFIEQWTHSTNDELIGQIITGLHWGWIGWRESGKDITYSHSLMAMCEGKWAVITGGISGCQLRISGITWEQTQSDIVRLCRGNTSCITHYTYLWCKWSMQYVKMWLATKSDSPTNSNTSSVSKYDLLQNSDSLTHSNISSMSKCDLL